MGPLARAFALAICLLCLTAASASAQATATTFTVTTTADGDDPSPGNGVCAAGGITAGPCTLRAAIQETNARGVNDTIVVPSGTYSLTLGGSESTPNASIGDLDITAPVTVQGAGARSTIIENNTVPADRVFEITSNGFVEIRGVTIRSGSPFGNGGGVRNTGPTTRLVSTAVRDSEISAGGAGISNEGSGGLTVDHSLVTGNTTTGTQGGGGISNTGSNLTLINSTISSNTAPNGAAIIDGSTAPVTAVQFSTITGNAATTGAAVQRNTAGGSMTFRDSIVGLNAGTGNNCSGAIASNGHNVESGNSCNFTNTANGDKQQVDPGVGPLAYSRPEDQTETHALTAGSPAINNGNNTGCPPDDQRGLPRPSGPACDSGAYEAQSVPAPAPKPVQLLLDPPTATRTPGDANTVTVSVRNDDGSPAANQSVRYSIDGANPTDGEVTTDAGGVARISWEGVHEGTDTLAAFVDTNKNLTSDQGEPTGTASVVWALPVPEQGKTANIEPVSGRVRITVKQNRNGKVVAASSEVLKDARQVPLSTVVDTRRGRVRMTTVSNSQGDVQKGEFYGGVYTTSQSTTSTRPITELRMTESLICQSSGSGKLTAARSRRRHLWGNARGRYRTRGRYSTATVRGTIWIQKDSCNTTTTAVRQGVVIVKDLVKRKNVRVKAGKRYTARKSRRAR